MSPWSIHFPTFYIHFMLMDCFIPIPLLSLILTPRWWWCFFPQWEKSQKRMSGHFYHIHMSMQVYPADPALPPAHQVALSVLLGNSFHLYIVSHSLGDSRPSLSYTMNFSSTGPFPSVYKQIISSTLKANKLSVGLYVAHLVTILFL